MATSGLSNKLVVYKNEPVLRLLTRSRLINPLSLGILFFVLVSLPLTLWAVYSQPDPKDGTQFVSFLENVSWSIALLYLFPFVVALTLKYYLAIPELFKYLFAQVHDEHQRSVEAFWKLLDEVFNAKSPPVIVIIITLVLNVLYFIQTLNTDEVRWLSTGDLLQTTLGTKHGFSPVGLFAQCVQVLLIYWILMVVWKGFVFA